jgi:hypothetical protein
MHKVKDLPEALHETSGIETGSGGYLSFNDSGGEPALYWFSDSTSVLHKTIISNAVNADWEDIASDKDFYYVADVGNNSGRRDTLTVYKIPVTEIFRGNETVPHAGAITFSYADPVRRDDYGRYSHDCEALFSYGDSLFLFTKNWVDRSTSVYRLPKVAGHYEVEPLVTYPVDALITGSDVSPGEKEVALIGYRNRMPVMVLYGFEGSPARIHCGGKVRKYILRYGRQTEGVCFDSSGTIRVTAEKRGRPQAMFQAY